MVRFVCQEKYKTHIRAEAELSERTQFFSTGIWYYIAQRNPEQSLKPSGHVWGRSLGQKSLDWGYTRPPTLGMPIIHHLTGCRYILIVNMHQCPSYCPLNMREAVGCWSVTTYFVGLHNTVCIHCHSISCASNSTWATNQLHNGVVCILLYHRRYTSYWNNALTGDLNASLYR